MPNRLPPPRDFNWARTLRTLSFWALLIVGAVALLQFAQNRRQEPDSSYTQFTEQLEAGNVDSVEITERPQIKGYLTRGVPSQTGRQYDQFTTLLPFESSDSWVATLREKGVKVRAREEKQSFGVFLFSFLPYLFILGLIIFMLRQMQQGGTRAAVLGWPLGRESQWKGVVLAECQHAGSETRTARSCPTCHGSGYVRVIPGPDGQPRRCQHADSKDNDPRHCPTCQGAGWAGLVAG